MEVTNNTSEPEVSKTEENVEDCEVKEKQQSVTETCSEDTKKEELKHDAPETKNGSKDETGHRNEERISNSKENKGEKAEDDANIHYEEGVCIYTEPESKCQFVWDEGKQEWVARNSSNDFSNQDYDYDGTTYTYTDKDTGVKYKWDVEKNEWAGEDGKPDSSGKEAPKIEKTDNEEEDDDNPVPEKPKEIKKQDMTQGVYGYENDTHIYTDAADGSKYFWDKEKNAWFPKVDDDFLAQYQMNYGFIDPKEKQSKAEEKEPEPPPPPEDSLKRKAPQEPTWFDVGEESTKVYVSGLPSDITETEFVDIMQKCGLVMRDVDNGKMKVKIYLDPETSLPKGDALCTYIKKESVALALDLLDGYEVRGHHIKVERAKFTMKGAAYDPSLKPKKRRKKDKEKLKKIQEKLFDWRPDKLRGERSKHEQIVIIKNLFDPADFNKDVKLILEYQQDLREECLKCGAVKKVIIYDRHPEGVAQINFKEVEAADACVQLLNNRWFGKRQITAQTWDGKTKYKMNETDEEIKARLEKWQKFLETGEEAEDSKESKENKMEETIEAKVKRKEDSATDNNNLSSDSKERTDKTNDEEEDKRRESEEVTAGSDNDTRSSVGSEYDTDDEVNSTNK